MWRNRAKGSASGAFYLIRFIYGAVRKREGLGLGDVKLAAVAGLWLPPALLPVWVLAATIGALTATLLIAVSRRGSRLSAATALPFGTYLAPALWLIWTSAAILGPEFADALVLL